jgi:hypothetical protein
MLSRFLVNFSYVTCMAFSAFNISGLWSCKEVSYVLTGDLQRLWQQCAACNLNTAPPTVRKSSLLRYRSFINWRRNQGVLCRSRLRELNFFIFSTEQIGMENFTVFKNKQRLGYHTPKNTVSFALIYNMIETDWFRRMKGMNTCYS